MSPRRPRFRRAKNVPPLHLTLRDEKIIRHVFAHRFLRSIHLWQLLPECSPQNLLRRLQKLYHHGYLDRPRAQLDYFHRGGSQALVYGVGAEGIKLLEQKYGLPKRKLDWSAKNRLVTRLFLQHTLAIADFMVALERSCEQAEVSWQREGSSALASLPPVRWSVNLPEGESIGVVPDAVFHLTTPAGETIHYCLEVDRGTMPLRRPDLGQTSVQRKLLAYQTTWQQGIWKKELGWNRCRVLFLTATATRAENIRRLTQQLSAGHGLFLFAHSGLIRPTADLLLMPWQTAKSGAAVELFNPARTSLPTI